MEKLLLLGTLFVFTACATKESQIADYLKKNPKAVFDVIEENPEQFIEVVNRAARKAQEGMQQKQLSEMRQQQEDQMKNPLKPDLEKGRQLLGDQNSKITIVEYADFQCPACRAAFGSLKQIKEKYKGQVQFYYKNMPLSFHKQAEPAARHYEAVFLQDRAKALKYYEYIFENQNRMGDEAFLKEGAKKLGVDMKRLAADLNSEKVTARIEKDMAEFEKFGFTGTPVILVNGVALHGAQPFEEIDRVISETVKN